MQFCWLPMKYSGAPLNDDAPFTYGIIFSSKYTTGPTDRSWKQSKTTNCFSGLDGFQSVRGVELTR